MIEGFKWHTKHEKLQSETPEPSTAATTANPVMVASTKVKSTELSLVIVSDNTDAESQAQLQMVTGLEPPSNPRWRRLLPRRVMARLDYLVRTYRKFDTWLDRVRNISPDQDPEMALPLRVIVPVTMVCAVYTLGRAYLYVEDYISLRVQPVGVYVAVNRYVPFWGDG
jgi:hypothetical protein